jgi:copper oxidase (laccase) domain-containing protein
MAGVVETAVEAMRSLGATAVDGAVGPCIHAECYEFSPSEIDRLASRLGDNVRARSGAGLPALDLVAGIRVALQGAGAELVAQVPECTACSGSYFSHRARGERERQAMVVWRPGPEGPS